MLNDSKNFTIVTEQPIPVVNTIPIVKEGVYFTRPFVQYCNSAINILDVTIHKTTKTREKASSSVWMDIFFLTPQQNS